MCDLAASLAEGVLIFDCFMASFCTLGYCTVFIIPQFPSLLAVLGPGPQGKATKGDINQNV
jgi:hypothetical protein